GFLGPAVRGRVGAPGAYLVIAVVLVMSLVLATWISAFDMAAYIGRWTSGLVRAGGTWVMALFRRRSPVPAAEEPGRPARTPRVPMQLVDPIEGMGGRPELVEKRDAPPPIIREPERKAEPARKTRRLGMQEER